MDRLIREIDQFKAKIDQKRPFMDDLLKQLRDYYKIGLTYTSNALRATLLQRQKQRFCWRMALL